MLKLMKYEILDKYKAFLILIIGIILLNVGLIFQINSWSAPLCLGLSVLIATAAWVFVLVWCIGMFSKDLYEEKGYLTYTLPQKGISIITSKLIISFVYFLIVAVIAGLFIRYFAINIDEIIKLMDQAGIKVNTMGAAIGGALYYGLSFVELLVTVYFAIAVTRIAIAKRRAGKFIAFIVFIVISIAEGFLTHFLEKLFPQQFYVKLFEGASGSISPDVLGSNPSASLVIDGIPINIASLVLTIVLFVTFYIATSYIIEKKIDL